MKAFEFRLTKHFVRVSFHKVHQHLSGKRNIRLKIDRFDVGLTLTFKLDFEKFLMGMDIDLGLTDIGSDRTVGRQTMKYPKNVSGSLYIGYRF
mgnify:CR=1 FL=1